MKVVVYESRDYTLLSMIEQALRDNDLPFAVIGGADVGLVHAQQVQVLVSEQNAQEAREIVAQITG